MHELTLLLSPYSSDKYDADGSTSINLKEFTALCYDMGCFLSETEAKIALKMLDDDGNSELSYSEFKEFWKRDDRFKALQLGEKEMANILTISEHFQSYDSNKNGVLDSKEFATFYQDLIARKRTTIPLEECLKQMDVNNNGTISFNEYINWVVKHM